MKYDIKNLYSITPSTWSGGKTYEILIGGKSKNYASRDFIYRVSSATVEIEESTFSDLPKFNRYITTLNGDMRLEHHSPMTDKKMGEIALKPFDVHFFDGGLKTISYGKVQDFNLMIDKSTAGGDMKSYKYSDGEIIISDTEHKNYGCEVKFVVFCATGEVWINNTSQVLKDNDYIIEENGEKLLLKALTEETKYIVCTIICKAL